MFIVFPNAESTKSKMAIDAPVSAKTKNYFITRTSYTLKIIFLERKVNTFIFPVWTWHSLKHDSNVAKVHLMLLLRCYGGINYFL